MDNQASHETMLAQQQPASGSSGKVIPAKEMPAGTENKDTDMDYDGQVKEVEL
jgi:hypothetical protein